MYWEGYFIQQGSRKAKNTDGNILKNLKLSGNGKIVDYEEHNIQQYIVKKSLKKEKVDSLGIGKDTLFNKDL